MEEMNAQKVYCKYCKYLYPSNIIDLYKCNNKNTNIIQESPLEQKESRDAFISEANKNNNCKYFEEKQVLPESLTWQQKLFDKYFKLK